MIFVLIIVIVALLAAVGLLVYRQRRSAQLREGFGPEYDRVVNERGDQRTAEAELQERRERRRSYDIKPLGAAARDRYSERWRQTQADFVDQPASALTEADALLAAVMHERGYPVEDFEQQAADISVDHPEVVEHYREAHAIHRGRKASTEDLRQAMVHYRALFSELLEPPARDNESTRSEQRIEEGQVMDTTEQTLSTRELVDGPRETEVEREPEDRAATTDVADDTPALLPRDENADFQRRWETIQTGFVDEPRQTVEQADEFVAHVMKRLAEGFATERENLEGQWGRGEDVSTEDLRIALQRYRGFFQRLLSA